MKRPIYNEPSIIRIKYYLIGSNIASEFFTASLSLFKIEVASSTTDIIFSNGFF